MSWFKKIQTPREQISTNNDKKTPVNSPINDII